MVAPHAVDRSVQHAEPQVEFDCSTPPSEVAQHEGEPEAVRKSGRAARGGGEALFEVLTIDHEAADRGKGKDALNGGVRFIVDVAHDPVAPDGSHTNRELPTVDELCANRVARLSRRPVVQGREPIAHGESTDPEPLLFSTQVELLGPEFVLELAGKVVKQVVPSHGATLLTSTDNGPEFSTAPALGRGHHSLTSA